MEDKRLETMKKEYESIPIPDSLRAHVEAGIQKAKKENEMNQMDQMNKMNKNNGKNSYVGKKKRRGFGVGGNICGGVVAALLAITLLANTSGTVANAMAKVPVLGAIVKVVTFRQYTDETGDMTADIKTPELSVSDETGTVNEEATETLNQTIEDYTNAIIAQYEADVQASGGEGHQDVSLDYQVITDNDRLFSIRFDQLLVMASGSQSVKIYHVDKQTGQLITLGDLFKDGSDYINAISDNIKEQMQAQMDADENVTYWLNSDTPEWDFQSITADSTFYINDAGKLVIVFAEYEVAPGYMGTVEFEIPTNVIQDMVQDGFVQ